MEFHTTGLFDADNHDYEPVDVLAGLPDAAVRQTMVENTKRLLACGAR